MAEIVDMGAERVLVCAADGPMIDAEARATDLVGEALSHQASMIAVPVARLSPDFFVLRTGLAGAVAQCAVAARLVASSTASASFSFFFCLDVGRFFS